MLKVDNYIFAFFFIFLVIFLVISLLTSLVISLVIFYYRNAKTMMIARNIYQKEGSLFICFNRCSRRSVLLQFLLNSRHARAPLSLPQ